MNRREAKRMLLRRLAMDLLLGDAFLGGLMEAEGIDPDSDDADRLGVEQRALIAEFLRRGGDQ